MQANEHHTEKLSLESALHRIEGDSLLCKGITLVAHFMELRILTKLLNLSRKFGFVKNNTTNDCFDAGLHFW